MTIETLMSIMLLAGLSAYPGKWARFYQSHSGSLFRRKNSAAPCLTVFMSYLNHCQTFQGRSPNFCTYWRAYIMCYQLENRMRKIHRPLPRNLLSSCVTQTNTATFHSLDYCAISQYNIGTQLWFSYYASTFILNELSFFFSAIINK